MLGPVLKLVNRKIDARKDHEHEKDQLHIGLLKLDAEVALNLRAQSTESVNDGSNKLICREGEEDQSRSDPHISP